LLCWTKSNGLKYRHKSLIWDCYWTRGVLYWGKMGR